MNTLRFAGICDCKVVMVLPIESTVSGSNPTSSRRKMLPAFCNPKERNDEALSQKDEGPGHFMMTIGSLVAW